MKIGKDKNITEIPKKYLKWLGYNDYEIETCKEEDVIKSNQYESFMASYGIATKELQEYIEMVELKNHTNRIWYNVEEKLPPCGELVLLDFGINCLHQSIIETSRIDSHGD